MPLPCPADSLVAAEFLLRGRVQGLGVRPAIARLAAELTLAGVVANRGDGVAVHVEGGEDQVAAFTRRLRESLPDGAVVEQVVIHAATPTGAAGFRIDAGHAEGPVGTAVPVDLAACDACLREVEDARDRRAGYLFSSCTDCGPRYTIIEEMPYERAQTAMREFALCRACREEYEQPEDRRFHAQTNACAQCGPRLRADAGDSHGVHESADVMEQAAVVIRRAGLVAVKGIGGYQLLCDATSAAAVQRLRDRKGRRAKPLAVMLSAEMVTGLSEAEAMAFQCPANPIVLVPRECMPDLAAGVAPGLNTRGVMRPTTPLHARLLRMVQRPLVITSGNLDGRPLAYEDDAAELELGPVADLVLRHDRRIVRPIDDSVVRCIAGRAVTIRAARGIAPQPLSLRCERAILAVGGHQKAAIALSNGRQCVLGPHIGDLDSTASRERYLEQTEQLLQLYGVRPEFIAHDLHPDYFTTRWALQQGVPTVPVQHHHAHIAAGMLQHGWLDREVLGVAFDGTGYGAEGGIWGGEFLRATAADFTHIGTLRSFPLPGGEQAIREPWRIALALVAEACGSEAAVSALAGIVDEARASSLLRLVQRNLGSTATSLGRLFDGVAAIVLGLADSSFEGEPAMMLEAVCDPASGGRYDFSLCEEGGLLRLDWRPLIVELLHDRQRGAVAGEMAMRFHRAVARAVAVVAARVPGLPIVLAGGCFQNRVLTELVSEELVTGGREVGLPGVIPPNDGGLAAGQLVVAAARLGCCADQVRTL